MALKLYSYWRSSAAYRVRIALELKGLEYEIAPINLVAGGGEHKQSAYKEINPQGLVPTLTDDDVVISQSSAILEYLEEVYPEVPLLPRDAAGRAKVRQLANIITCDVHPLNNLRVTKYVASAFGADQRQKKEWMFYWMNTGFGAFEKLVAGNEGSYCFGNRATIADACLVPQVYNARRFGISLEAYPRIESVANFCLNNSAFVKAAPENQVDAQKIDEL